MKTLHKILLGGGVFLTGAGILAYDKFQRTKAVFDNLSYFPKISNFDINLKRVKFDLRVELTNNLNSDLSLSTGGLVKLTKFIIYDLKGQVLAVLKVNDLYKINIPAYGKTETPKVTVEIPLANIIPYLPIGKEFIFMSTDDIMKILRYGFEIKTFYGKTYTYTTF